jgi:hypothetical protein
VWDEFEGEPESSSGTGLGHGTGFHSTPSRLSDDILPIMDGGWQGRARLPTKPATPVGLPEPQRAVRFVGQDRLDRLRAGVAVAEWTGLAGPLQDAGRTDPRLVRVEIEELASRPEIVVHSPRDSEAVAVALGPEHALRLDPESAERQVRAWVCREAPGVGADLGDTLLETLPVGRRLYDLVQLSLKLSSSPGLRSRKVRPSSDLPDRPVNVVDSNRARELRCAASIRG